MSFQITKGNRISNIAMSSDILGAVASGLCVLHCLAAPILFVAQSCTASQCCNSDLWWWNSMDYFFIVITFFAVRRSGKKTAKNWMKYMLFGTWILLAFFVINEQLSIFVFPIMWKHLTATALILLHMYNLRYCQCKERSCCVHTTN